MKDIKTIRRAVATMANQLHKLGYSLSQAFRTAWRRIKDGMKVRVSGVTQGKRQELLQFIAGRKPEELTVYLQRDRANVYDKICRCGCDRHPERRICAHRLSPQDSIARHGSSHGCRRAGKSGFEADHWRIQLQGDSRSSGEHRSMKKCPCQSGNSDRGGNPSTQQIGGMQALYHACCRLSKTRTWR